MDNSSTVDRFGNWLRQSIGLKVLVMGLLLLILLIPATMIQSTIRERETTQTMAVNDIASKWGTAQIVSGPWITIPYRVTISGAKGEIRQEIQQAYFLPEELSIQGDIATEIRYRGIYEAVLYHSALRITGRFTAPNFSALNIPIENVLWDQATIAVGIADMRGIRSTVACLWNGKKVEMNPGIRTGQLSSSGVSAALPGAAVGGATFSMDLDLNGSQLLSFIPLGKTTNVTVKSPWKSPSFTGNFLPVERRITPEGFDAKWQVLHLNRNFPQSWAHQMPETATSAFGVSLVVPADQYQKVSRSTKYAVLFVLLTFGTMFFIELWQKQPVHVVQYLLIGLAIVFFYSLLLSLAEHVGFDRAYGLSSAAIVAMISLYAKGIFVQRKVTFIVAGLMGGLYAYLYILLQIEDYTLLIGNLGLLAALSTAMYFSRRIEWSKTGNDR